MKTTPAFPIPGTFVPADLPEESLNLIHLAGFAVSRAADGERWMITKTGVPFYYVSASVRSLEDWQATLTAIVDKHKHTAGY